MRIKNLVSVLVLFPLLAACNLRFDQLPSDIDVVGTAVELTAAARLTEIAGSVTPTSTTIPALTFTPTPALTPTSSIPTQCSPLVTSTVNANVRSGPGTAYDVIGSLMLGQTATITGRNDANTWWYIAYPGVSGGYAWIAGSVVTSACVPSVVQVVAAPPLPTAQPVVEASSSDDSDEEEEGGGGDSGGGSSGTPDLHPTGMSVTPNPATQHEEVQVLVGVINDGDAPSGSFTMQWWQSSSILGCSWTVASLAPGESTTKSCPYTYGGWSVGYNIRLAIDSGNTVTETNEGNNVMESKLKVNKAP